MSGTDGSKTENKKVKENGKVKKVKRKLGMGLSSLLSKDQELASVIRSKIKTQVQGSNSQINKPALSEDENNKISILNMRPKDVGNQRTVPIQYLISGKFQPRKFFDQTELEELAESIRSNGVLQPILVRPINRDGKSFEIIAGERRWRAAQIAKLHEVPVIVREFDDETAIGVAMIENLQRSDLNLVEEANGYRTMMNVFQYTQEKLSSHLGKSRSHIANVLRILSLPKNIKRHIISGEISFGHARALVTLPEDKANQVTEEILSNDLSVRETEKIVNKLKRLERASSDSSGTSSGKNANVEHLEKELTSLLGLRVIISHKNNNSGNMAIYYKDLDQIQPIIDKLKWRPK
jgi:ParB family chromosome partitioning protein